MARPSRRWPTPASPIDARCGMADVDRYSAIRCPHGTNLANAKGTTAGQSNAVAHAALVLHRAQRWLQVAPAMRAPLQGARHSQRCVPCGLLRFRTAPIRCASTHNCQACHPHRVCPCPPSCGSRAADAVSSARCATNATLARRSRTHKNHWATPCAMGPAATAVRCVHPTCAHPNARRPCPRWSGIYPPRRRPCGTQCPLGCAPASAR